MLYVLFAAFCIAHLAPFGAVFVYLREERRTRGAWQVFPRPLAEVDPSSAYRSAGPMVTGHLERAPSVVRLAAASSLLFGSMFLPGLAWGLFGLIAAGIGLLSIPGLILAASLWGVGFKLLRAEEAGAHSAVRVAMFSIYFNMLLVLGALVCAVFVRDAGVLGFAALVGSYALLSLGQAALVTRAAQEIAKHHGPTCEDAISVRLPDALRRLLERRRARVSGLA